MIFSRAVDKLAIFANAYLSKGQVYVLLLIFNFAVIAALLRLGGLL